MAASYKKDFYKVLRAITRQNKSIICFNLEGNFQWAQTFDKHVSIFVSRYEFWRVDVQPATGNPIT
jgi:hypothetical protein